MSSDENLADRVERLEQQQEELRAENRRLRAVVLRANEPPASTDKVVGRRELLRKAGLGAAAAAGGLAVAGLDAGPASANDGDAITVGNQVDQSTNSTARTVLYAGNGGTFDPNSVLNVVDQQFSALPAQQSAAIYGAGGSKVRNGISGASTGVDGAGVDGLGTNDGSVGVFGHSLGSDGTGVLGSGTIGVEASGSNYDLALSNGRLGVLGAGYPSLPSFASHGDQVTMTDGTLWYCVAGGSPGTWRRLAAPGTAGAFTVLPSTARVYDSRPGNPPHVAPQTPLAGGQERSIDCTQATSGLPAGATAVLVNLTIVDTVGSGYLALFKDGTTWPGNSSINWASGGAIVANSAVVAANAGKIRARAGGGSTDFVIDLVGYYE